jgi:uncharacterized membrane protein
MAHPPPNNPPQKNVTANSINSALNEKSQINSQSPFPYQQTQATQLYQGPVPHPDILEKFDQIVPGTAQRLFQLAEDESIHRRRQEEQANLANINAQQKQLLIAEYQTKAVYRSDCLGQFAGILISLCCIGGAIYLSLNNHEIVAGALAAIPTASVIQAFFSKKNPDKPK